jgi:hypothetical protein
VFGCYRGLLFGCPQGKKIIRSQPNTDGLILADFLSFFLSAEAYAYARFSLRASITSMSYRNARPTLPASITPIPLESSLVVDQKYHHWGLMVEIFQRKQFRYSGGCGSSMVTWQDRKVLEVVRRKNCLMPSFHGTHQSV